MAKGKEPGCRPSVVKKGKCYMSVTSVLSTFLYAPCTQSGSKNIWRVDVYVTKAKTPRQ
ncbi:hypothetical protein HPP92_028891 [Vanilla planifolia]|uniref:Uncharacterized protein n=1 Tax=Vanilla planifolia TaxID=51239 RepID=A0A835P7I0_VANPL|nr:hypothetical protein HPP92_028891 [Vanilla planifolia]KAG0446352.1 hypothetical protein HPP92_028880 [Vanilla planifolia]